mgnify:CR=1 FL=1
MACRIQNMRPGQSARIVGYEGERSAYRTRLLTMGLTRGTEITLVRVAPLGDPVDIHVRGFNVSLRKDEASVLQLECVNGSENEAEQRRGRGLRLGHGRKGRGKGRGKGRRCCRGRGRGRGRGRSHGESDHGEEANR